MSHLTSEQLAEFTRRINARIAEFDTSVLNKLSAGVARLAYDEFCRWQDEQEQKEVAAYNKGYEEGYSAGMTVNAAVTAISHVHGPTGAAIAEVGTISVHNNGDGTAEFDHEGTPIHFRITLDDDEANMDRYFRGWNAGYDHAMAQLAGDDDDEPDDDGPEPEPQSPSFVVDPEWESKGIICGNDPDDLGVGARMTIAVPSDDDDPEPDPATSGNATPQGGIGAEITPVLPPKMDGKLTRPLPPSNGFVPMEQELGADAYTIPTEPTPAVSEQAAATLGPEHVVVNPVKPKPKPIGTARDPLPDPDVARERIAHALANGSNGDLVKAINKPRTLAEADATLRGGVGADEDADPDAIPKRGRKHNVVNYEQMLTELQRQAMAGVMPSQADFNYSKPAVWPVASSLCARFGASWDELRQAAGLKVNPKAERYAKATV